MINFLTYLAILPQFIFIFTFMCIFLFEKLRNYGQYWYIFDWKLAFESSLIGTCFGMGIFACLLIILRIFEVYFN